MNRRTLTALVALATPPALAQSQSTSDTEAPAEATEQTQTAAEPSVEERLATAEGKLAAFEEKDVETQSALSALKKLKLSGYVQGRYTYIEPDDVEIGGADRAPGSRLQPLQRAPRPPQGHLHGRRGPAGAADRRHPHGRHPQGRGGHPHRSLDQEAAP